MIPFFQPKITRGMRAAVSKTLARGTIGPGPVVRRAEQELAALHDKKFCVLTTSGTVALSLSAFYLSLFGKRVAVPAFAPAPVWNAFASLTCDLVPLDVSSFTGSINDPKKVEERINEFDALCFVRNAGLLDRANTLAILHTCKRYDKPVIDDAACAIGGETTSAIVTTLSFSTPKLVTAGQGGAILTDDWRVADFIRGAIDQQRDVDYATVGTNLRMTDMQAALIIEQIGRLSALKAHQKQTQKAIFMPLLKRQPRGRDGYLNMLSGRAPLHNVVFVEDPDRFVRNMLNSGIEVRRQYPRLKRPGTEGDFPGAQSWWDEAVYLPFGPGLTMRQARHIGKVLAKALIG